MSFYLILGFLLGTSALVYTVQRCALHYALLDTPNARSLHAIPVPRLGGLAFMSMSVLYLSYNACDIVWFGPCIMALIGLVDDLKGMAAKPKLGLQILVASMIAFATVPLWAAPVVVFILVGLVNTYNFVDGLDGYVGTQAVGFLGLAAYFFIQEGAAAEAMVCVGLGSILLGFLPFNLPKASIFMGDCGSFFIGTLFGVLLLKLSLLNVWAAGMLMLFSLPFGLDVVYTLYRRWQAGKPLLEAHREHLYQQLHLAGYTVPQVLLLSIGLHVMLGALVVQGYNLWG